MSGFSADLAREETPSKHGSFSENQIWDNYHWFIEQVMPVAEANGVKMALHPDDPPVAHLHGIARVFTSANNMEKAVSLSDSPSHGLTFCQGTFVTMNENVYTLARDLGRRKKIFFVHIRDVQGNPHEFRETFHDNGPTDMFEMMKIYQEIGFEGPLRSDHVPTMAGEDNQHLGYEMKGNLFGIGYIKGLMHACGIATS